MAEALCSSGGNEEVCVEFEEKEAESTKRPHSGRREREEEPGNEREKQAQTVMSSKPVCTRWRIFSGALERAPEVLPASSAHRATALWLYCQ